MTRSERDRLAIRIGLACLIGLGLWTWGCGEGPYGGNGDDAGVADLGPSEDALAQNLLLLTVDTWRGDHFGASRADTPLTPELDAFAETGLRFTTAQSVGNATSPGVAGILTGWFPFRSGVVENRSIVPSKVTTLATRLQRAGFETAAFVANPVIGPGFGFEQGFGRYELLPRRGHKVPGEAISEAGIAWLEDRRGSDGSDGSDRWFLWLHYMEPHGPYTPPSELRDAFPVEGFDAPQDIPLKPEGDNKGWGAIPWYQQLYGPPEPSRDGRDYEARYAAEVRALDAQAARVLETLARWGMSETTAVILTSDHGEALGDDHGYYFSHGNELTRDQIHVPLVVRYPGMEPGVTDRLVSTADVVPTVLELVGMAPDPNLDGVSLLSTAPRPAASQSGARMALRSGSWKTGFHGQTGEWTLYDLTSDPGETRNLVDAAPEKFAELKKLLTEVRRRPPIAKPELRDDPAELERRKELEALGYL